MTSYKKDFERVSVSPLAPYEDANSPLFIDRYGMLHNSDAAPKVMKPRLGAFAVICAHGHILLNFPPWATDCAELPGGGVRAHETVGQGLLRELEEETGLRFDDMPAPVKANEYYLNLYAEDVETYMRYVQRFYYFDFSDMIAKDQLNDVVTAEGSASFWQPVGRIDALQMRFGHEHIIREAALHECQPENIGKLERINAVEQAEGVMPPKPPC
jgi:8-oxo-dGTP pyrophosphatase MutT (NUDIX family)